MAAHTENGRAVSEFLRGAPGVEDVRWPGFGGMVSFRHPDATRIAAATEIFLLAESLGGVESLIEVPQAMTHQSVEDSAAAVPADLVRLSCGVEAAEDLVDDLACSYRLTTRPAHEAVAGHDPVHDLARNRVVGGHDHHRAALGRPRADGPRRRR